MIFLLVVFVFGVPVISVNLLPCTEVVNPADMAAARGILMAATPASYTLSRHEAVVQTGGCVHPQRCALFEWVFIPDTSQKRIPTNTTPGMCRQYCKIEGRRKYLYY